MNAGVGWLPGTAPDLPDDRLVGGAGGSTKAPLRDAAVDLLTKLLADVPVLYKEAKEADAENGIKGSTLHEAK